MGGRGAKAGTNTFVGAERDAGYKAIASLPAGSQFTASYGDGSSTSYTITERSGKKYAQAEGGRRRQISGPASVRDLLGRTNVIRVDKTGPQVRETVKTVGGYDITRLRGFRGPFTIRIDARRSVEFKTIKEAEAWANANRR